MKRVLAMLLTGVLTIGLLTGCGKEDKDTSGSGGKSAEKSDSAEKEKFTIMGWGDPSDLQKYVDAAFEAYPELAEKYEPEIMIAGKGDVDVYAKLRLALTSGEELPDIVQINRTGLPEFAAAGVLEDLTEVVGEYEDNLNNGAKALAKYEDTYLGIPYEVKTKLWFYRQDIFEELGIKAEEVKNLDDFIAAGKKVQEKYPDSYMWDIGTNIQTYNIGMILSGNGAKFTDDEGNYIVASDPGVKKAFEVFKDIKDAGISMNVGGWTPDWKQAYADGSLVSTPSGDWLKNFIPQYAPELAGKWAVAQFPEMGDAVGGSEAGGSLFVVPKDAEHKEAAIEVFSKLWLTSEGNFAFRNQEGRESFLPLTLDAMEDESLMKADPYFGESLMKAEVEALKNYKVFDFTPASDLEFTILNQYLDEYLNGNLPLEEALEQAQTDMVNQIGNPFDK